MTSLILPLKVPMIFFTTGPAATQCGHWKSMNSMIVTGASFGPYDGESSSGMMNLCSAKDKEVGIRKKIKTRSIFMNSSPAHTLDCCPSDRLINYRSICRFFYQSHIKKPLCPMSFRLAEGCRRAFLLISHPAHPFSVSFLCPFQRYGSIYHNTECPGIRKRSQIDMHRYKHHKEVETYVVDQMR